MKMLITLQITLTSLSTLMKRTKRCTRKLRTKYLALSEKQADWEMTYSELMKKSTENFISWRKEWLLGNDLFTLNELCPLQGPLEDWSIFP